MKNGFTLVELSIVLVIIGLLVGGVLIGQSLIDSAKISSQIRQIQQFDIAVSQFKNRFRGIPGDSPLFASDGDGSGFASGRGDGNGFLQGNNTGGLQEYCHVVVYVGECDEFWKQLGDTGMIDGSYSNDYSSGIIPDVGAPQAVYDNLNVLPYYLNDLSSGVFWVEPVMRTDKNYFILQGSSQKLANTTYGEGVTPVDAIAMDSKLDDGDAATGVVRAISIPPLFEFATLGTCLNANDYDLSNPEKVCSPLFEMLSLAE